MLIAVIDGQGGGMGKQIIEKLRATLGSGIEILALGTNSIATSSMLKAGADHGATGENPVIFNAPRVDLIVGPIAIILANGLMGEISPRMAEAISSSSAKKILIPSNKCNVEVVSSSYDSLSIQVETLVESVLRYMNIDVRS